MIHPERVFSFKELESEDDLVEALINHKWPICYGFYFGNLLYLGDADNEDKPEYAVMTIDKTKATMAFMAARWEGLNLRECQQNRSISSSRRWRQATTAAKIPSKSRPSPYGTIAAMFCRLEEESDKILAV